MQQALGWLRWTPDAFWGATLAEIDNAIGGFLEEARGIEPRGAKSSIWDELREIGDEAVKAERAAARQQEKEAADER